MAQPSVSTSDLARMYPPGVLAQLGSRPPLNSQFALHQQYLQQVSEAGGPNNLMQTYMQQQQRFIPFHAMMTQYMPLPNHGLVMGGYHLPTSTAMTTIPGATLPTHMGTNMMMTEDMSRFSVMPQHMIKKTPRKGNIQTQEDELAQNVPEPPAPALEAPKRPKQMKKQASKPRHSAGDKETPRTKPRLPSKTTPTRQSSDTKPPVSKQTTPTQQKPRHVKQKTTPRPPPPPVEEPAPPAESQETSLAELLRGYLRQRPAVCSIYFNASNPSSDWKEKGIPGHFAKPSDVRIKDAKSLSFEEIVSDPGFESRRTTEASNRQSILVQQFESVLIDEQETNERVEAACHKIQEKLEQASDLNPEATADVEEAVQYLQSWGTVANEHSQKLQQCLRSFEKAADSHQRSISTMISKHGPKRPRR